MPISSFQDFSCTDLVKAFKRFGELKRVKSLHAPFYTLSSTLFLTTTRLLAQISERNEAEQIFDWMVIRGLIYSVIGDWREELLPPEFLEQKERILLDLLSYSLSECPTNVQAYYLNKAPKLISTFWGLSPNASFESDRWLNLLCITTRSGYAGRGMVKCIPTPTESEADHSLVCALIASLLCRVYDESPIVCCIAALFHHLRCLSIPNSDHEADEIIAQWGEQIREHTHKRTVSTFPMFLRTIIDEAFQGVGQGCEGIAKRFFEADIIDRTVQLEYYIRMNEISSFEIVNRFDYFNQEPLKSFQINVLRKFGFYGFDK